MNTNKEQRYTRFTIQRSQYSVKKRRVEIQSNQKITAPQRRDVPRDTAREW